MRLGDWLRSASERLALNGVEASKLESQVLAGFALSQERSWILAHSDHELTDPRSLESLLNRRLGHEPLAYITGRREFYGRVFRVQPGVLIPRQETETLIESALGAIDRLGTKKVLDVGVGSGAIAVTLKLERPGLQVTAIDISSVALEVAKANALALGAEVELSESNLFSGLNERRFDLIVSNPPYIGRGEALLSEVRAFEPEIALFGGETGLKIYEGLAEGSEAHLEPGGEVWLEIGHEQEATVTRLWEGRGWLRVGTSKDLLGHVRVLGFRAAGSPSLS
jgi:release factor glutamine methyltransferase